ncbi:MAG: AMP-binding protein, partial [Mycobacterium sp.]
MTLTGRLARVRDMVITLRRAGLIAPLRPDKYLRMITAMQRENLSSTSGFASAARRCPDRPGLIDELGMLTWRQLDQRSDAFAAALQALPGGTPAVVGIMCRNHRGFIEALVAANRIGADVLLLNTSFAGPALADVVAREGPDVVVYDEEFTVMVDQALTGRPDVTRIIAWADTPGPGAVTVENMITVHGGHRPARPRRKSKLILLTSGTTGTPKGAKRSGGGPGELAAVLKRTPWRAEETVV